MRPEISPKCQADVSHVSLSIRDTERGCLNAANPGACVSARTLHTAHDVAVKKDINRTRCAERDSSASSQAYGCVRVFEVNTDSAKSVDSAP